MVGQLDFGEISPGPVGEVKEILRVVPPSTSSFACSAARLAAVQSGGGGRGPTTRSMAKRGGLRKCRALSVVASGRKVTSTGVCPFTPDASMVSTFCTAAAVRVEIKK